MTSYELRFGRAPSIFHLRPFSCRCFVLKRGNLDKFESRSSNGIFLGYSTHGHSYRIYNLDTHTIIESCDVTFNESAPSAGSLFETAGDREMQESIFVDEDLQDLTDDGDVPLHPAASSPTDIVPASTTGVEGPHAATSSSADIDPASPSASATAPAAPATGEGEFQSRREAPRYIQKDHPPEHMIGNLE